MKEDIELKYGLYFVVCGIVFFQILNRIIKFKGPPAELKEVEWKWRNLYVSWVHGILVVTWALMCVILYPEMFQDLFSHINYFTYFCVCFSTGYFTYDLLDSVANGNVISNWEVTLHHLANGSVFYYNVLIKSHIGFNIIAFFLEFNSIFLHWRKLLQMVSEPYTSRRYLAVKHLNLLTFLIFRYVLLCHHVFPFVIHTKCSNDFGI